MSRMRHLTFDDDVWCQYAVEYKYYCEIEKLEASRSWRVPAHISRAYIQTPSVPNFQTPICHQSKSYHKVPRQQNHELRLSSLAGAQAQPPTRHPLGSPKFRKPIKGPLCRLCTVTQSCHGQDSLRESVQLRQHSRTPSQQAQANRPAPFRETLVSKAHAAKRYSMSQCSTASWLRVLLLDSLLSENSALLAEYRV